MTNCRWRLNSIERPDEDGIYEVRLTKRGDLLSSPIETIMEFIDGEWQLRVPMFINEYMVYSWRYR